MATWPHHYGMFESAQRGYSILPALALVAVLGLVAAGIERVSPTISRPALTAQAGAPQMQTLQTASVSGALAAVDPNATPPSGTPAAGTTATKDDLQSKAPKDCDAAKEKALEKNDDGQVSTTDEGKKGTLDTCFGAVLKEGKKPSKDKADYECVGRVGQAIFKDGKVTAITKPSRLAKQGECKISVCRPAPVQSGGSNTAAADAPANSAAQPGYKCEPTQLFKGGIQSTPPPSGQSADKGPTLTQTTGNTPPTPLDPRGQQELNNAFKQEAEATQQQIQKNNEAIDGIKKFKEDCKPNPDECGNSILSAKEEEQKKLEDQNKALKDRMDQLAASQVALAPVPCPAGQARTTGGDCATVCRVGESPGRDGCYQAPGVTPPPALRPPPPPAGPPPGAVPPPPNNATGFGNGSGAGGLGSFLGGLASALGKAAGTPQPPQQPAQQCSTDPNIYAQQQQQYQQQMQQYNYQLQQYNYQQQQQQYNSSYYGAQSYAAPPPQPMQPQPCSPSTSQQCTAQPQQPPASSCSVGYWKPTYSGTCITNWQCTSTEQLKAEISCQPKVADPGMTLAISYACSSGVATSTAFTVTAQSAGSATATVAVPPAGTNTATYGLTCIDGSKTAGAQCSVQVSKASIILVANPRTVPANGVSLLGWITTGMKSCVVSSADQADFTARNFSNTSPNGTATTSPISSQATFLLHCETLAGGTKDATTTVAITQ